MKIAFLALTFLSLSACNEYWWTRGQPPASYEIFSRAQDRISELQKSIPSTRPEIQDIAGTLSTEFQKLLSGNISSGEISSSFESIESSLMSLEGKLSYGNRPPLQELSGQFRALKEKGLSSGFENISTDTLRLFAARVLFMLSSEIKVPAPDAIIIS